MGPELVIFDCDGTLIDSETLGVRVDQRVLADQGWDLALDEVVERFMGRTSEYVTAELERHLGRSLPPGWEAPYASWYVDAFEAELTTVDGIESALERITSATCVASNSAHDRLRFTLGKVGLLDRFEGRIFSAEDVPRGKPAPDLYLHAARTMGVPPHRCVVVEDSKYGVQGALAAGMPVLAYAGGLTPSSWFEGTATRVFHDMSELPELLAWVADRQNGHPLS